MRRLVSFLASLGLRFLRTLGKSRGGAKIFGSVSTVAALDFHQFASSIGGLLARFGLGGLRACVGCAFLGRLRLRLSFLRWRIGALLGALLRLRWALCWFRCRARHLSVAVAIIVQVFDKKAVRPKIE